MTRPFARFSTVRNTLSLHLAVMTALSISSTAWSSTTCFRMPSLFLWRSWKRILPTRPLASEQWTANSTQHNLGSSLAEVRALSSSGFDNSLIKLMIIYSTLTLLFLLSLNLRHWSSSQTYFTRSQLVTTLSRPALSRIRWMLYNFLSYLL